MKYPDIKVGGFGAGGFASHILIPAIIKEGVDKIGICNFNSHSSHHKRKIWI